MTTFIVAILAVGSALSMLAAVLLFIAGDDQQPDFPPAGWLLLPAEEAVSEEEIPYDPLDHRIPLAEVERRMAAYAIQGARELVAA